MTELLKFAENSPWWTLIYLCVISGAVQRMLRITVQIVDKHIKK